MNNTKLKIASVLISYSHTNMVVLCYMTSHLFYFVVSARSYRYVENTCDATVTHAAIGNARMQINAVTPTGNTGFWTFGNGLNIILLFITSVM